MKIKSVKGDIPPEVGDIVILEGISHRTKMPKIFKIEGFECHCCQDVVVTGIGSKYPLHYCTLLNRPGDPSLRHPEYTVRQELE